MYYTLNDLELMRMQISSGEKTSQIIKDLIKDDLSSQAKKDMADGVNYYQAERMVITEKDFRVWYNNQIKKIDLNAANNKLINAFHTVLVNQKNSYICGNPIVISSENTKVMDEVQKLIDPNYFDDLMCTYELNSSNKGIEYIHPYVDENGKFNFVITDAEQIIPIYDTNYQQEIAELIRYYKIYYVDSNNDLSERFNVEWWKTDTVEYYVEDSKGNYILDSEREQNPAPHFSEVNTATGSRKAGSWGRIPFVPLPNNNYQRSDLKIIKSLIDDYDLNTSDFSNNLANIQEAIWEVAGYEGAEIDELRNNLKVFKIVKVDESGRVKPIQIEIPREAREAHLNRLEDNIFMFGMGVNPNKLGDGNITNVVIKSRYALLDLKANIKIRKFTRALKQLMYFPLVYLNVKNPDEINFNFTFNKNLIINTQENVMNCNLSKGTISDETIIANHPFVNNVNEELERLKRQKEENQLNFENVLNTDEGDQDEG